MDMADKERIPTNLRTLLILEIFANSQKGMTPTEITRKIDLPKQTVHRLCTTLVKEGFLIKSASDKRLRPSRRLRLMASGILHHSQVHIARHQVLQDVARQVGETVNLVIAEKEGMTYLDRVETRWSFRVQLPVGTHVPFHCTASGKTYLASLPPKARHKMVDALTLDKLTPKTHGSKESLLIDLAETAKRGYATDDEEFIEGMVAIAVPVRDTQGRFIAALAFHGPLQRLTVSVAKEKLDVLHQAAQRLGSVTLE